MQKGRINLVQGFLLILVGLGPSAGIVVAQSSPSTAKTATAYIYPQPLASDPIEPKEIKRFERAWKDFSKGSTEKAEKEWAALLKKYPASPALLTALSYVDYLHEHPNSAMDKLERAVQSAPQYLPALQTLVQHLLNQKNYERAYSYMIRLGELRPDDSKTQSDLEGLRLLVTENFISEARAARAKGNWAGAESAYLKASSIAPELQTLARDLGDIYVYEGKWIEAEHSYRKAVQLDGTDLEAKKKLAQVYMHNGQPPKAQELLKSLSEEADQDEEVKSMLDNILAHSDPLEVTLDQVRQKALISRGDFAALLAFRFPFLKEFLHTQPVILTDIGSHWGKKYLPLVATLNLMPAFPNHQFRPNLVLHRYEAATAVDRLLSLVSQPPNVDFLNTVISDVPRTNPHRNAISRVVSSGLMKLDADNRFNLQAGMSGEEVFRLLDSIEKQLH